MEIFKNTAGIPVLSPVAAAAILEFTPLTNQCPQRFKWWQSDRHHGAQISEELE